MELEELYQQVIIDHSTHPKNYRVLLQSDCHDEGYNPLCGDKVTVYIQLAGDEIKEVTFQGEGCAISQASASLMTEAIKGKSISTFEDLARAFNELTSTGYADNSLGKLSVLGGVSKFPMRVKCATLAWHTVRSALKKHEEKNGNT